MVEYKQGTENVLMEVNGRVWGSLPLAVLSGVDFPGGLADLCMGNIPEPREPPPPYRVGIKAYHPDRLLVWLTNVALGRRRYPFLPAPGRSQLLDVLHGLLTGQYQSDFADPDDPAPARFERSLMLRLFVTRAHEALTGRRG
jgi:hypothetical protein